MFTITDYSSAIFVLIVTMLCWGSWPNTQRLTQTHWRFELFYWDYATGLLISALLLAFTLGSVGTNGPDFLTNIQQSDESSIYLALSAGIIFNIGNLLFVAAINYSGMAVAFPVGGGLGLVIGVTTNYFTNPRGDALWLFTGVICILLAMLFTSKAYSV